MKVQCCKCNRRIQDFKMRWERHDDIAADQGVPIKRLSWERGVEFQFFKR
jgi:hypothetical protein